MVIVRVPPPCRFVELGYGTTACNDGLDNDLDGDIDAEDIGCSNALDDSELNDKSYLF